MKHVLRSITPKALRALWLSASAEIPRAPAENCFDPDFYGRMNEDVAGSGVDLLTHFRRHGFAENRHPNPWFTESYVFHQINSETFTKTSATEAYMRSDMSTRPRLIFVSHDASRTGAPAIILRLLEIFSQSGAFECFTILDHGGERLAEFEALSHTYVMSRSRHDHAFSDEEAFDEFSELFTPDGVFETNPPVCALVNSAESFRIARHLEKVGVPVISLVHEIASYYQPQVFEKISKLSQKVVFPSEFVSQAANLYCDLDMSRTVVRGQGLLDDDFGQLDRENCRALLRQTHKLEDDAFVVLNVGTIDIRKGADMFVDTAKLFFDRAKTDRPVHFIWYGGADQNFDYAQQFLETHGLKDRVHLMPSTSQIERVFLGGDLFFLTARADPFPCVIHEAMACGLPVIAFKNGGGAPELIGEDCGQIVDMADLGAAATAIETYVTNEKIRDTQSHAAKAKIKEYWQYIDYQQDVYNLIKDAVPRPKSGWPKVHLRPAFEHLVIMHGRLRDLHAFSSLPQGSLNANRHVVLIDGRFGQDIDHVADKLRTLDVPFSVHQPLHDTDQARAQLVSDLLRNPKPRSVTLINTLEYLSPEQLQPLSYPASAVITGTTPFETTYLCLPHLDELYLDNEASAARLYDLNPELAKKLKPIGTEKVTRT